MVQSNTVKKETLQCDKMRIWRRDTISEKTVKDCTPRRIIDREKENNIKAPSIEKIQNQKTLHMGIHPLRYLDRCILLNVENIVQTGH